MARSKPKKKKDKGIFEGVRKKTAPPTKRFKTKKKEKFRKRKHKGKEDKEE